MNIYILNPVSSPHHGGRKLELRPFFSSAISFSSTWILRILTPVASLIPTVSEWGPPQQAAKAASSEVLQLYALSCFCISGLAQIQSFMSTQGSRLGSTEASGAMSRRLGRAPTWLFISCFRHALICNFLPATHQLKAANLS